MVLQDPAHPKRVLKALAALIADPAAERLRIAVAYASLSGVNALRTLVAAAEKKIAVEIVVTLDLGVTRKAALKALLHGPEQAMAIETGDGPGTFHTKVFVVDRVDGTRRALVGSANLTGAALTHNHEAISVGDLSAENGAAWEGWWSDLCSAAEALTPELVESYVERRPPPGRRAAGIPFHAARARSLRVGAARRGGPSGPPRGGRQRRGRGQHQAPQRHLPPVRLGSLLSAQ